MENAPKTAFARARPVAAKHVAERPLVLQPECLADPPDQMPVSGAWLIAAVAAETRIMTPTGPRPAGRLVAGDAVLTLDDGPRRLLWAGRQQISARQVAACPDLGAVAIPSGAFGGGSPRRPLRVSPRAGVLVQPMRDADRGVLVQARDLCGHAGIVTAPPATITYVQLLLERHAVIAADGLAVESFHPGWLDTMAWESRLRAEVLAVLPDLEHGLDLYGADIRPRAVRAP